MPPVRLLFCLRRCLILLGLSLQLTVQAQPGVPQRIVSFNLCADQWLLMLVERERIASISHWTLRPENSHVAALAEGLPANRGRVEELLPLAPDLVLAGRFNDPGRLQMLRRLGYRVEALDVPEDIESAVEAIRAFGALVGAEAAAEVMAEEMAAGLQALQAQAQGLQPRLAAVYAANGVTAGRGTVLDQLLRMAGLRNLAAELGIHGYGSLPLEQLLWHQPELLVIESNVEGGGESLAERVLRHPALESHYGEDRRVVLPASLTACVGPMNLDAVALLLAAR